MENKKKCKTRMNKIYCKQVLIFRRRRRRGKHRWLCVKVTHPGRNINGL
jgi:hypothetical protein